MDLCEKKQLEIAQEKELAKKVNSFLAGNRNDFKDIASYLKPVIDKVLHTKKYPGYYKHLEDIKQECWIEVVKNLSRWDPERGTLKNFMFKCFANRAMTYLHKNKENYECVPNEELERLQSTKQVRIVREDLDLYIHSRFTSFREQYVLQKVCIAVYLGLYDRSKNRLIQEIRVVTRLNIRRIVFLIDYSLVTVRRFLLEGECQKGFSDVISEI